jgi:ketosteroid isomerase-like protein
MTRHYGYGFLDDCLLRLRTGVAGQKGAEVADQSNVQLVRDAYEAFGTGDMEAVGKAFAEDIVWRIPGRYPLAGVYHSKAGFFDLAGRLYEQTSGTFRQEVRDVFGRDETVVALLTLQAERNGKTFSGDAVQVWRVENGKAVEVVALNYDPYALDEFWS